MKRNRIVFFRAISIAIALLPVIPLFPDDGGGPIRIFPCACIPGTDTIRMMAFYDHDPKQATTFSSYGLGKNNILDYMGGDNTYDGHIGSDFGPAGFEDQDVGIAVVAVADGVVSDVLDGVFDRENSVKKGVQGNFVLIDHGGGRESYYNHLRKGSVCVKKGEHVSTGQQIGLLGSSGNSTWPHLHFEWRENGVSVDPFSGPINPIVSRWSAQPPYDSPLVITDCGLYYPENRKKLPFVSVRETYAKRGESKDRKLQLLITVLNVPETEYERKWRLVSPDSEYVNEWTDTIDGSKPWHGLGAEVWQYSYSAVFSKKASPGRWRMEIYHDGQLAKRCFFTVDDEKPSNSPPAPPKGVKLAPPSPEKDGPVACVVDASIDYPDPDMDKICYRYEWLVDGRLVRNATSVTRLDYCPAHLATGAKTLTCKVYTSDGRLESEAVESSLNDKE
ncbi:MAG: M23 family metallopeptidase [Spirochaetales bacterium]|nr:M23 family metallopeptidase [Spirochaetales bacterium]